MYINEIQEWLHEMKAQESILNRRNNYNERGAVDEGDVQISEQMISNGRNLPWGSDNI